MDAQQFMSLLTDPSADEERIRTVLGARACFFVSPVGEDAAPDDQYAVQRLRDAGGKYSELRLLPFGRELQEVSLPERSFPFNASVLVTTPFARVEDRLHALPGLTLARDAGPSVMITSRLSGCTIVYQPPAPGGDETAIQLIHIQPRGVDDGQSGARLQTELEQIRPRFAGQTLPTRVFGRKDLGKRNNANLIALRRNGRWGLYVQEFFGQDSVRGDGSSELVIAGVKLIRLDEQGPISGGR